MLAISVACPVQADYVLDLNAATLDNHIARSSLLCREVELK